MAKRIIDPSWGNQEQWPIVVLTLAQFCLHAPGEATGGLIEASEMMPIAEWNGDDGE